MAKLGCGHNVAAVVDRETGNTVTNLDDVIELRWERTLDTYSTAEVTVGRQGRCCARLDGVRSWRHELVVWREHGGQRNEVWRGPIMRPRYQPNATILEARDKWAWLDRRDLRRDLELSGDVTEVAVALIEEALKHPDNKPDETGLKRHLDVRRAGVWGSFEYKAQQRSIGAELRNLADGPLNMTFLGGKLVLFGPEPLSRTAMIQDKDLLADIEVLEDGLAAATRVTVVGQGVRASCGGTDPYYGLIEQTINDHTITSVEAARALACSIQATVKHPPLVVSVPNGAQLSPKAPVPLDTLVPGVEIPFWSERTCRKVDQNLVLTRLEVVQNRSGERVLVTATPGVATADFGGVEGIGG